MVFLASVLLIVGLSLPAQHTLAQSRPTVPVREFTIGTSTQGRPITAVQFGDGPRKLVVVGDTHGGPEENTHRLTLELIQHFRIHPEDVPPQVRLYFIPTLNPDGLYLNSRFNAMGVDLNRNMNTNLDACPENDWGVTVAGAYGIVSNTGGAFPDSEVESRLIRDFLLDASGAIFLHSNAGLVFPAFCEHLPSNQMAEVYARAAGYSYQRYWDKYMITGGMHDWAASIGITAIIPELISGEDSEFVPNLAGLRAVLDMPEALLLLPDDKKIGNVIVPALIWRYWRTHGGEAVFGMPLHAATVTPNGMMQTFTNARIEVNDAQRDTLYLVQPATLGTTIYTKLRASVSGNADGVAPANGEPQPAPGTYSLYGVFLDYWNSYGGADVFGYPLSEEFTSFTADGQARTVQFFERAAFAYYPEDGSVRPEPLGWEILLIERMQETWVAHQIR